MTITHKSYKLIFFCNYLIMINKNKILNKVFSNNTFDIECLINNISSMSYPKDNYEFELRIVDNYDKLSCLPSTFKSFPLDNFHKLTYSDDIVVSLKSPVRGVYFRTDIDRTYLQSKTNITTLYNFKRNEQPSVLPLVFKLNIENVVNIKDNNDIINTVANYQRKQRVSYCSTLPLLKNWRIDKTVRLYINDIDDIKLTYPLSEQNVYICDYYDALDIEFEYIGDFTEFELSLYKLFEYIYRDDFKTFNLTYNMIDNILYETHKVNLSNISSEVGIITNEFISKQNISDFVYEEKFDGEKVSLVMFNGDIYEMTKKYFKLIYQDDNNILLTTNWFKQDKQINKLSIVDAEKIIVLGEPMYIIFDCLLLDNEWLNDKDYITRLKACKQFIENHNNIIACYRPKCYSLSSNTKWEKLIDMTEKLKYSRELQHVKVDGLILHKINSPFIDGELYKLKNSGLMTTDFLLKWVDEKQLYLIYTIGYTKEIKRRKPIINPWSEKHFGYSLINKSDSVYILFDNPYIFNIYEFKPDNNWLEQNNPNNKYYTDEHINEINMLVNNMISNPLSFNNKIIELSLYKKLNGFYTWIPMRVRTDKIYPNGYRIGLSNIETIYNKLSIKSRDENKQTTESQEQINKRYKTIIDKLNIDKNKTVNIIVNIASGSLVANNLTNYLNIDNIYFISTDKMTLINNFNNIQIEDNKIIDVSCIHYNNINELYNKLLYSSFTPNSISLFIDECNINKIPNNILEYKGVYININNETIC